MQSSAKIRVENHDEWRIFLDHPLCESPNEWDEKRLEGKQKDDPHLFWTQELSSCPLWGHRLTEQSTATTWLMRPSILPRQAHFSAQRIFSEYSIPFCFQVFYPTAALCRKRSWKAIFHCFIQVAQAASNTFQISIKQIADITWKRTRIFSDKTVDFFDVLCQVSDVTSQRLECLSCMPVIWNRSYNTLSDIACFCEYADDIYRGLFVPKMTKWLMARLSLSKRRTYEWKQKIHFVRQCPLDSKPEL